MVFITEIHPTRYADSFDPMLLLRFDSYHFTFVSPRIHLQLIHFFGVPLIIWSLLVGFSHVDLPIISISVKVPGVAKHNATYATLLSVAYVIFYIYLDTFGGLLYTPFAYALYISAVSMKLKYQEDIKSIKTKNANAKPSTSSSSGT